jgi:hypothetical protein
MKNLNTYLTSGASLFLVLYAGLARPQLPPFMVELFENPIFRVLVLSLVVFMGGNDAQLSLMVAVAFTVTMNLLNEQKIAEGFVDGIRESFINEGFLDDLDDIDDMQDDDIENLNNLMSDSNTVDLSDDDSDIDEDTK